MSVSYKSTTSLATGSWQHLAVTVDQTKGTVSFFLNNTLVGTQNASISILQNSQNILIGRNSDSEFFNGMMDDVRVYSRVLSADELGGLFNYKNEGSLISKYDFEKFDLTEMKVYDEGPYGYTGTLKNLGANDNALTNDVGEFAINNTAFESLVDEYVEIDGSDPTNKLQGVHLNNCTFAAWVKLSATTDAFEPIMVKPGVLSFGVKNGRVVLKLGDGSTLHELPVMSTPDAQKPADDASISNQQIRLSNNGYTSVDVLPAPIPSSPYFKKMGYRAFEWNFEDNMYDNAAVFKMHTVDARSKTHNKFYVNDETRMAASFGKLSASTRSYMATNWCRETNNEYWYLRAGYDGMEMPPWGVGKSPLTITLRFKFMDPSNLNTSAVSIMYGQGAADEGFINQTWNHAQQENYHVAAELYGTAATTFQMRCSVQEGKAGAGRTVSSVFSGTMSDIYVTNWNTMILVHDPENTKTYLYLNNTLVCTAAKVTTFPQADLCKLRVGTYPIDTAKYVNRGMYIKDVDLLDTALSEPMVKHYFQNRREALSSEISSEGGKAHYTFDEAVIGANSFGDTNHIVNETAMVTGMGVSEGSRAVRFDPTDTSSVEIPGEVFSSEKSFFFGTWIKPESLSGYRPIVSRVEGENNMHFGVRNGVLEFSASRSAPVTLSDVSAKHVYDHQDGSRVCNVLGTVSNSGGGTVYIGLFEKFYSNLMGSDVKTFMVDTMNGASALKEFVIPSDAFGVSIACSMNEFFANLNATASQDLSFATQQLNLVVLVVDPSENLTVKSYPLEYMALNGADGTHTSGKAELYMSDGYTYALTTMREENTPEEYTDWYLVLNYLRKENETVRAVPRAPIGMSSSSNTGYEGFPMQRQEFDAVDINGDFVSETYNTLDMNAQEFGPWGHADNELFGMLVDKLGDHGVEMLFKGKTASHDRVMNFSTGWSWLVDYFRNGFEVAPGGFNQSAVHKRPDHTTNLPDEATTFPDNKMDFAMSSYPFYHSSYRNYLGADNESYWSLDESAKNTTMFQQIWVRGRRDLAKRSAKPMMISNNDARNKSLSMGNDCVVGEPYTMVLTNGDRVEMSDCYKDTNKKVSNLFSHSMNDSNHSGYGSGNNWRAIYTFAKGDMEAVSMKFYQAESYQTKQIDIYYTTDDSVAIASPLEDWTPVSNPSLTEFHTNTKRTVLRVDFAPVKASRFMIVTTSWNAGHTYYGLMEWMIYGYDAAGNGVVSDLSDKNAQHNNADTKFVVTTSYDFNSGERSMLRITDTEDPYYQLFLKHMNENRGIEDSAFGGSDSVIKAQLNNDDVIYYNCMYSYSANTGWTAYDATNMFKDETILNVIHQNAYNSYQSQGWRFAQSSVTASPRTGTLIYEFANGRMQKIRGIQVHGHTNNSMGFSAKVRVFYSMSDIELDFEEFKEGESSISLLISETNTFLEFGEKFPATNKIMLLFESVWEENFDVSIRDLRIIGEPVSNAKIISTSQLTLQRNNDVVTGQFNYSNLTGSANLYINAYAYDYTGGFVSTSPTMRLLPTNNKEITFELTNVLGIDNTFIPAKAVNYIKLFALIEDTVLGTRKMLNVAQLLPENQGDVQISIDRLFYESLMDVVQADIYAYSSYADITGVYGLLTSSYIEDKDETTAKTFILQNASTSNGCVVYKSVSVLQYAVASESLGFSHVLSEIGGAISTVSSGESYYVSVLLEDSTGGISFSKRNLPTKSTYYDLNRIFAGGHDSSYYPTGFGNNTDRRSFGEGNSLKTWLSQNTNLIIREVIGGGYHGYVWCYAGDRDVVYGWGYNVYGELAYITSGTSHSTSVQVNPVECNGITNLLREKKASILQFKSGNNFGMLLLSDGKMYSWGNISSHATGFSESKTHTTITECDIFTNHCQQNNVTPVDFACTQNNTIILFSDGTVWGIGNNSNGLLGVGHANATGAVLVACTNVNEMLEDGYEIDLMCARGNAMTYRLKKRGTDELSWWGMGENRHNRTLGTTVAAPVLDMTRLNLMEDVIATFPDPKNYVVGVGPTHWTNCCIIDLSSNKFWYVGYGHYLHWTPDNGVWVDRSSHVNMAANKFVFCAMYSYGIFLASTNDRTIEYQVLDSRSIVTTNRLNVANASTDWSSSTGITFNGTILASDTNPSSTYTFYATSNLDMTREQAISVISAGTSAALQSETMSTNERLSLKNHIVRNMEVSGKVVPSNAYPKYKLFVYAESNGQQSMEVLINQDEPVPSLFPNVVEGSFDPFDKTLKVKASVTDSLNTPSNMYVAAFAEPPSNSMTNTDIKNIILSTKHLSQVKSLSLSGLNTGKLFLSNTLSFGEVFNSVYPQLDEATYESMKANGGTEVVSENSSANIGLVGSTSDATWYVWENKYQSGQTVKKWTLHNGDSLYTNSHGEKWFDGDQENNASYQPQMYNTSETWIVQGTSRGSVKSWRYFYDVAEPRTINTFKLFNHSTNGAQFIKSIGVWNTTKQIYEPVQLNSGSFPMNCFEGTTTSAYKNMHLSFEAVTLEPGRPLMIHMGKMATNLYVNEMQLVYETPPPVIPTFFKYMKLRVRTSNGSSKYFTFSDLAVLNMQIQTVTTSASTAHGHAISRIVDDNPDTYHQTERTSAFDVFLAFTHGLPTMFQMKFVNIWNNQAWKDVDVYVSTDNTNWMLSKEVRGLGFAEKDDLLGRTTVVECALPPNVVPVEDIEYSIYAVAENSVGNTSISKFTPPPTKKAYLFDRVKSMGYNNHYEAARGTDKTDKSFDVATEVTKFLDSNPSIQMIDIIGGGHFAIFEVRNNRRKQFYGIGYNDQRGIGGFDDTNRQSTVVECTGINSLMASENSDVKKLACGWYHCMVLLENGKMYGFGYNGYGQLGTNNTSDGGKNGLPAVMINDYCEENNTEVVDFACTGYNTFVYLKNNTIRVAGRWNGHGQLGRNNTSETNNTTFYHVSHMDSHLSNAKLDFIKCDYGSVMYRVVKNDTGEAKWYGAGQNTDKAIGYNGGQTQVIVECNMLNAFIEEMGLENNYDVVKGMLRATILIDNRDGRLYGIGDFGQYNPDMNDTTVFKELTNINGETFLNYNDLAENSTYPMRVVKYATLGYNIYVGGTSLTGHQPFEYLDPPTGNLNILRIKNMSLTTPDRKGIASLTLSVTGSIIEDTRYYVVLTTDDRVSYDFNDEANASSQATYNGVLPRSESLSFEAAITEIPDISGNITSLRVVSKVRAYVFVTDGTHRDYQVYDFGPFVSHATSAVSSVSFSPITDMYQVDMDIGASKESVSTYNMVILHPDADFPDMGEQLSYSKPLIMDSYGTYDNDLSTSNSTVSGWIKSGERSLIKKAGLFDLSVNAEGKMQVEIQSVHKTSHLERLVDTPASSTLWRFKIYTVHGGHTDYATFTQLVLTDESNTYPTTRHDQGANSLFDGVGITNTNVHRYSHGHKITYQYASEFTPTKMIWAYKATNPTRAPTRFLIQYCTTTNRTTEADWEDYVYVNLDVEPATNSVPTFHHLDINVVAPDTPRTLSFESEEVFAEGDSTYAYVGMTLDSSSGMVQFFKNCEVLNLFENNYIRMPAVQENFVLDTSADTRYLALRKGVLSKKNMINEHFSGREDLITLITSNSVANTVNLPVGKYSKTTTNFTSALESLDTATSLTVVPEIAYRVLGVFTDVNGSVVFGDQLDTGTQYTTVTYGWASGHNNGNMMMYTDGNNGSDMDFYPTKIFNDFMSANPSYKCLNIEMGGYALMCMIEVDGVIKLYATGYNASGQIGNGNTTNQSTMVEAKLFNDYALENNTTVKMVRVGWNTTCVLYENGIVMCVGTNGGSYANGNDTNSSTAVVEASLVTAYCQTNDVEIVDFAIANGECCYLFSNGKVLGNGYAMGTADNAHNLLKETALNDLMGTDYECTLMRSMHQSFNFRLTHKTTGEEKWYGTGHQYYNGGGAPANQTYYTTMTPLTKLEALLASFEDPKDYTYVMGCFYGASFVRDNRANTFWRIGYMHHIPAFGNTTEFVEVTTYITKEWCETNTHSRLTNFTPVYWRMNGYGIFAFGNPLGVEPDVIGGSSAINLTTMSIESVEGSFDPFPEPSVHLRHSDVGVANNHSTYTTSTESGMTYVQTLSNGDKAHSSATFVNHRNVSQIFTGIHDNWGDGAWHGPNGATTMSAIYEFTSGDVLVDTMNFVNVPGNNHWAGDIQILYWNGTAFVDVVNRSAAGFSNAVHSEEISITFDQVSSFKFKIVVDRHANNTTTYVGLSEWSIHGFNTAPDTSAASLEAPIDVYFTNPDYTLSSYAQKPTISELTLYSGPDYTGDVVPYTIEAIHIPTGHPDVYTPLELHTRFTDGINEGTYWYSVDPSGTGNSSSTGLETMDGVDVKFFTIKPSAPVRSAKVVMLMLHMAPAIKLVQGSTEVRAGGLRSLYPSEQEYWDGGLSGSSSATDSILFYAGLNLTSTDSDPDFLTMENTDDSYSSSSPAPVTQNEISFSSAEKRYLMNFDTATVGDYVEMELDVTGTYGSGDNTVRFADSLYLRQPGANPTSIKTDIYKFDTAHPDYSVSGNNLVRTDGASFKVKKMRLTSVAPADVPANPSGEGGAGTTYQNTYVSGANAIRLDFYDSLNADTPVMYTYTEWIHGQDGIFTQGFPVVYPLRVEYSEIDFTLRLLDVGSPSTESSTVSPTVYVNLTMNGSVTESTYYVVASLDSTLDMVRMKNLIATSNPALVAGTLEQNADGVTKSLSLKKVADAHTNVYDLTAVPFAYLFVYLKDANGVEDFDATAQIIRPNADLSEPYFQMSSAVYESGTISVEGTLFNSSVLTGYYVSAFTSDSYLVSETPTALPTGESMTTVSISPNVPFVFSVNLATVYADDTYASSSDIFGNEGQLALRLITTDGTTPAFKDFDYAMGDFIVSTVAAYTATNDSITATVTKKNVTEETNFHIFASTEQLSVNEVIQVMTNKNYDDFRSSFKGESTTELQHVISHAENKVYNVSDVSTASLYTFGTNAGVGGFEDEQLLTLKYDTNADFAGFKDLPRAEIPVKLVRRPFNPIKGKGVDGTTAFSELDIPNMFSVPDWGHHYDEANLDAARVTDIEPGWAWLDSVLPNGNEVSIYHSGNRNEMRGGFAGSTSNRQEGVHPILIWDMRVPTLITKFRLGSGSSTRSDWRFHGDYTVWWSDDNVVWNSIAEGYPNDTDNDISSHKIVARYFGLEMRGDGGVNFIAGQLRIAGRPSIPQEIGSLSVPYSIMETNVSRTMPSVKMGETEIDSSNRLIVKNQQVSAVEADSTLYTFGLKLSPDAPTSHFKNVTTGGGKYLIDGVEQPTITIYEGDSLALALNVASHPLWIKTVDSTGPSNAAQDVTNNGSENGVIFWTPSTAGTYYYNCEYHAHMKGTIKVLNKLSMTYLNADHVSALANQIFASDVNTSDTYTPVTASFNIRADSGYYYLNEVHQPTVNMTIGDTVTFTLDGSMSGHPLWIKTERSTGNTGAVADVNNNGANSGAVSWTPTSAGTYYYNCQHHSSMGGPIVITEPSLDTEFVSNSLSNVFTQTISGTDIAVFSTPIIFTDIFTSIQGDIKTLDGSDHNLLMVSVLKSGDNAGYVSRYAILQMDVDVSGADHGTNNGHSILTDVTENGFTHRNTHGTWSYYVKLDEIGLNGIGFNTGLVFEYKTDRATAHRYQPITLLQDQTPILSIYCSFYSNSFQFAANMSTSTQSALRSQLVLGDDYKITGTTTLVIEPKNGNLNNVTHMFHRFIFVDHETDPDLFDVVFEFLDQDRNLIFRSRMDYFHTNSASSFGGGSANPSNFSKSMTSFDLRVYSYANQTAIQYTDFSLTNKNAIRDSFTPLSGSSYPPNQTFSS